jgi:ankyrin repeat protein
MKTTTLIKSMASLSLLALSILLCTANDLQQSLQKGLVEEEVNLNLDAAIKAYQAVLDQFAEQRKIAATATFRLAESYRKQGKTNEALVNYRRVVEQFPEQTTLVELSRRQLPPESLPGTPAAGGLIAQFVPPELDPEEVKLLEQEIKLVERQVAEVEQRRKAGRAGYDEWIRVKRDLLSLQRKLPENSPPARQQALIEQEMELVERLLADVRKRKEVGAAAPIDEVPLERDLLALRRELLAAQKAASGHLFQQRTTTTVRRAEPATADTEETRRIQQIEAILRTSPDLLNSRDPTSALHAIVAPGRTVSGATPLHSAVDAGNKAITELLLRYGADINAKVRDGETPLHLAAGRGYTTIVETLIAAGADLSARGVHGQTPLHRAAQSGSDAIVNLLIDANLDINARDRGGMTPLHYAARSSFETSKLLLSRGADIDATDPRQDTPLHYAAAGGQTEVIALFLNPGRFELETKAADVNARNSEGFTPLHYAVRLGFGADVEAVKLLLAHGADPQLKNNAGLSPLDLALGKYDSRHAPQQAKPHIADLIREHLAAKDAQ